MAERKQSGSKSDRLQVVMKKVSDITAYAANPRRNERTALKLKKSIEEFGFKNPIILDENDVIVAGHARLKAAMMLGMEEVPCVYASGLTEDEIRAFRLADNKTAELAGWDYDKLCDEMVALFKGGIELGITGFDEAEQFYYLGDDATPDREDREEFREYQDEAERDVILAYNVSIVCDGQDDKAYLMELLGEPKKLKRLYTGNEIRVLQAAKGA